MSKKDELHELEKNCIEVKDYIELFRKALEEPSDREYASELIATAEEECKFPNDFVLVAEGYSLLGNHKKAYELYEEAEDSAFEPLEFAQIGNSIFAYLNDSEKANELLRRAVKDVTKLSDAVSLLGMLQNIPLGEEAFQELFGKIQAQCKSLEDYRNVTKTIIEEVGNIQLAKTFVQLIESKLDGIEAITNLAVTIFEMFNDKEWAIRLLDEISSDAKFTKEYIKLAECYRKFSEFDKAMELMENAKDYAVLGEEFLELAFAYWDFEQNTDLCVSLIEKSLKDIKEQKRLIELAKFSSEKLKNQNLTQKILLQVEARASTTSDYINLIQSAFALVEDDEFKVVIYDKLLEKIVTPVDLISVAEDVVNRTEDIERGKKFFDKAIQNCSTLKQMIEIAEKANILFKNKQFTFEILNRATNFAKETTDYLLIAEKSFSLIDDKIFGRKNLETAEELVTNLQEIKNVHELFVRFLSDELESIQRVNEKLAKREMFQSKYDEFRKIESDAKYLQDYLNLAERVVGEIDDAHYCRNLLSKAEKFLDTQFLNVENYFKLAKAILKLTADTNWAILVFDNLYWKRIVFINDLLLFCKLVMGALADKEMARELCEKYINNWKNKVENPTDALKIAKIMVEFDFVGKDIVSLLDKYVGDICSLPIAIEFLKFATRQNFMDIIGKIKEKVWELVRSSDDILMATNALLQIGEPKEKVIENYMKFVENINDSNMLLSFTANFYELFGNNERFNEIVSKITTKLNKQQKERVKKIHSIFMEQKYW